MAQIMLWLVYLSAVIVYCTSVSAAQTRQAIPEEDTQVRPEVQLSLPLEKRVDLILNGQVQIGRNVSAVVNERAGVAVTFKVGRYLTLSPSYQYFISQPAPHRQVPEHRPNFATTVRLPPFRAFTISDRHLVERRIRQPVNTTRYRNRLMVEHPLELGRRNLRLFVADEVYYDWGAHGWVRNQFAMGASKAMSRHVTGELYYMRQMDGRSRPGDLHILGTVLRIRI